MSFLFRLTKSFRLNQLVVYFLFIFLLIVYYFLEKTVMHEIGVILIAYLSGILLNDSVTLSTKYNLVLHFCDTLSQTHL